MTGDIILYTSLYARRIIEEFQKTQAIPEIIPGNLPTLSTMDAQAESAADTDAPAKSAEDIRICIAGAGAAGLYAAMLLDDLDLKYEILEASKRAGGRVHTFNFPKIEGSDQNEWRYYDKGAMRYPRIPVMSRVYNLMEETLKVPLIPYRMNDSEKNQFHLFNSVRKRHADIKPKYDNFLDSGHVPQEYVQEGPDHWLEECFKPFKKVLKQNFDAGFTLLMKYDGHSCRSFMQNAFDDTHLYRIGNSEYTIKIQKKAYPIAAVNWLERGATGTGLFDQALTEMVIDDLLFDYPTDEEGKEWPWYCVKGGSEVVTQGMLSKIKYKPTYSSRVISIAPESSPSQLKVKYRTAGKVQEQSYDYVISTLPLSTLRLVNLDKCNLHYHQKEGMRSLYYDSSCKVGIRFKTRWWEKLGIKGGQSRTDRFVRTVVYPSYGIDDPKAAGVLLASYTWSLDALRVAGLINVNNAEKEAADLILDEEEKGIDSLLITQILDDLAVIHEIPLEDLRKEYVTHESWDFNSSPDSLGAFALFGPGQFQTIYPAMTQPAAGGHLFFAGELLSRTHAWVEGALESAYWAVYQFLHKAGLWKAKGEQFKAKWGSIKLKELEADKPRDGGKPQRMPFELDLPDEVLVGYEDKLEEELDLFSKLMDKQLAIGSLLSAP